MTDKEKIIHLMNQYCFALDSGELEKCANLFDNAEWVMEGFNPNFGSKQVMEALSNLKVHADGTLRTRHLMTNIDVRINNKNETAKSECYITAFQQVDKFALQPIFSGHYIDNFKRSGESWRFVKRFVKSPFFGDMSEHIKNQQN